MIPGMEQDLKFIYEKDGENVKMLSYTDQILNYTKEWGRWIYWITVIENEKSSTLCVTNASKTNDCYSISKIFTVTALGMLFDHGNLDTDEKIVDIFKDELPDGMDIKWNDVTVHQVMCHKWGIEKGFLDIDVEDINTYRDRFGIRNDFLKIILSCPLPMTPGGKEVYSDAAYYLLSRVVAKKSGENLYDFLRKRLFNPLNFEETAWSCCPMGYSMGATGLFIRTGDIAKLGQLYMNKGMYKGQRILSETWCNLVLERGYELRKCNQTGYCKGGMYGQILYIDSSRNLSVAWQGYDKEGASAKMTDFLNTLR